MRQQRISSPVGDGFSSSSSTTAAFPSPTCAMLPSRCTEGGIIKRYTQELCNRPRSVRASRETHLWNIFWCWGQIHGAHVWLADVTPIQMPEGFYCCGKKRSFRVQVATLLELSRVILISLRITDLSQKEAVQCNKRGIASFAETTLRMCSKRMHARRKWLEGTTHCCADGTLCHLNSTLIDALVDHGCSQSTVWRSVMRGVALYCKGMSCHDEQWWRFVSGCRPSECDCYEKAVGLTLRLFCLWKRLFWRQTRVQFLDGLVKRKQKTEIE